MLSYTLRPDEELVALLCNSDHGAYTEIYNRYSAVLYLHAYKRLKNREEARDLIHELFTALWIRRHDMVLRSTLSSYLYKSVRNRVIDLSVRKNREIIYVNSLDEDWEADANHTDYGVRQRQLYHLIDREIEALPEKMKVVFNLSRKDHLSHKQISGQLQISEFTVRKQISNALKILKPKLNKCLKVLF